MRRLSLLACALLLAAGVFISQRPLPVLANPPGCEVAGDVVDRVYIDWNNHTTYPVNDSYPGGNPRHDVNIDLWAYRESHDPGTGVQHCYRGYYASAWTGDGSGGNFFGQLRTYICAGSPTFVFQRNTVWGTRNDAATTQQWGNVSNLVESVTLPSGATVALYLADYGIFPIENGCLPSADTEGMSAGSPTWTTLFSGNTYISHRVDGWFCYMNNGAVCY